VTRFPYPWLGAFFRLLDALQGWFKMICTMFRSAPGLDGHKPLPTKAPEARQLFVLAEDRLVYDLGLE
jgi:hypothetical protein